MFIKLLDRLREAFRGKPKKQVFKILDENSGSYKLFGRQYVYHQMDLELCSGKLLHLEVQVKSQKGGKINKDMTDYVLYWTKKTNTCHMKNREMAIIEDIAQLYTSKKAESAYIYGREIGDMDVNLILNLATVDSPKQIFACEPFGDMNPILTMKKYQMDEFQRDLKSCAQRMLRLYGEVNSSLRPI